ncbi:MAG: polysaccharide pyruvyl transferase family protein [Anaerolineae bacterium]
MKILILNLHSVKNAGDLVLNNTALQLIREEFPHAKITVSINDLDETEKLDGPVTILPSWLYWMKFEHGRWHPQKSLAILWALLRWRFTSGKQVQSQASDKEWQTLLNAYTSADIVMSCPGNFLYTSGFFSIPFLISCLTLQIAIWAKKPLYLLPQTIGPITKWHEKRILSRILKQTRLIFVRDDISKTVTVDQLKIDSKKVKVVPDTAFASQVQSTAAGLSLLAKYQVDPQRDKLVGITTINWGAQFEPFKGQKTYEAGLVMAIRNLIEQNQVKVILFSQVFGPNAASDDRKTAERVYNQLQDLASNVLFIEEELDSNTLKSAYGAMDFFIGSRLHSNIFALVQQIPVVAIQYQYKTAGIMTMAGLKDHVIKIEDVSPETMPQFLTDGYRQRDLLLKTIQASIPTLKQEAASIIPTLRQDYESL